MSFYSSKLEAGGRLVPWDPLILEIQEVPAMRLCAKVPIRSSLRYWRKGSALPSRRPECSRTRKRNHYDDTNHH